MLSAEAAAACAAVRAQAASRLGGKTFVGGERPSAEDVGLFHELFGGRAYLARWARHLSSFPPAQRAAWGAPAAGGAACTASVSEQGGARVAQAPAEPPEAAGPPTELRFLDDAGLLQLEAAVTGYAPAREAGGLGELTLDATVFYPQGGGQPWDTGVISGPGGSTFAVEQVVLSPAGVVLHRGRFTAGGPWSAGARVQCAVDGDRRLLNTRVHTAGHLVGMAAHHIDGMTHLMERKGYHFSEGPYVEFEGTVDPAEAKERCRQVEEWVGKLVQEDRPVLTELCSAEALADKAYLIPSNLPSNKPIRVVTVQGFSGVPCGGTHTASTGAVGRVSVRAMKNKKNTMQIKYQVE